MTSDNQLWIGKPAKQFTPISPTVLLIPLGRFYYDMFNQPNWLSFWRQPVVQWVRESARSVQANLSSMLEGGEFSPHICDTDFRNGCRGFSPGTTRVCPSPSPLPLPQVKVHSPAFSNSHSYNYRRINVLLCSKCKQYGSDLHPLAAGFKATTSIIIIIIIEDGVFTRRAKSVQSSYITIINDQATNRKKERGDRLVKTPSLEQITFLSQCNAWEVRAAFPGKINKRWEVISLEQLTSHMSLGKASSHRTALPSFSLSLPPTCVQSFRVSIPPAVCLFHCLTSS